MGNDKTGSRNEVGPNGPLPGAKAPSSKVGATPASAPSKAKAHRLAKKGTADGRIGDTPIDTFDDNQPGAPHRESVGVPEAERG